MIRFRPTTPSLYPRLPRLSPRLLTTLGCLALAGAVSVRQANAYVYEPGNPRWSAGTVTFVLSLGPANRTLSDGSTSWDTPASRAIGIWNQYMQSLQLSGPINDSAPVAENDGVNSIAFASTFFGDSFGSGTLAITGYYYSGGRMTEANVLVNNHQGWDSYRGALRFSGGWDIQRVLIHEIGHALGLDHPDQHNQNVIAVMNSVISNADTAMADDIAGIQSIYGARTGGATPTPTPTPNPTATPTPTPTPNPTVTPNTRTASISVNPNFARTGQTATFTVSLSSSNTSPVTVGYIAGGNAKLSLYSLSGTPGQVTIPAGSTSANFTLTVVGRPRRMKTVTIYLTSGSAAYSLSPVRSATVTISK